MKYYFFIIFNFHCLMSLHNGPSYPIVLFSGVYSIFYYGSHININVRYGDFVRNNFPTVYVYFLLCNNAYSESTVGLFLKNAALYTRISESPSTNVANHCHENADVSNFSYINFTYSSAPNTDLSDILFLHVC